MKVYFPTASLACMEKAKDVITNLWNKSYSLKAGGEKYVTVRHVPLPIYL